MIYFVQPVGGGRIKIGTSMRLTKRLRRLVAETGQELRVIAVMEGGRGVESALHRKFHHLRAVGEYFEPGDDLLGFIVESAEEWDGTDEAEPGARGIGGRRPSGRPRKAIIVQVKGSPEWSDWLKTFAGERDQDVATLIEEALSIYAHHLRHEPRPPKR